MAAFEEGAASLTGEPDGHYNGAAQPKRLVSS
jgi:hypothetical protein